MSEDREERDLRAAEYVLGTLDREERAALARERLGDPAIDAAVKAWERRLAPFDAAIPPAEPGPRVWAAIVRALPGRAGEPDNDNRVRDLSRSVRRWRLATAGAGALAAGLAVFVAVAPGTAASRYVAVVNSGGAMPALLVSVDTAAGTARVRPVGAETPPGRSLELWYVGADKAPRTLGLVGPEAKRLSLPAGFDGARRGEGVFAVSVEPAGGSPTGLPTGPVVYTGTLIRD